ncbi:DUF1127 domain-containing protein [Aminobacter sp. HY435]|uniref:DUF1127 domain-containing protein n=1 Tax=Aminobacter sp. HY435 TaxID=2970917 RepID=UPI0022B9CF88|nr:DUF1127 domain-containing protein [Aminobacter sp. HY435]
MTTKTQLAAQPQHQADRAFRLILRFLARGYDRHLQRLDLSELDDHALNDIGLSRRDVEREIAKPFWR